MQWVFVVMELLDWVFDALSSFAETPDGAKRLADIEAHLAQAQGTSANAPQVAQSRAQ